MDCPLEESLWRPSWPLLVSTTGGDAPGYHVKQDADNSYVLSMRGLGVSVVGRSMTKSPSSPRGKRIQGCAQSREELLPRLSV